MTRIVIAALVALTIAGCASQVMKQYIGKDIRQVYLEHGKSVNEFDLDDGNRVFQFYWGESSAGSKAGMKGGCLLSYITTRNNQNSSWTVVDIKYPDRLVC